MSELLKQAGIDGRLRERSCRRYAIRREITDGRLIVRFWMPTNWLFRSVLMLIA